MKDCSDQERLFSHTMPQIFGMGASTLVFAVMMFAFDWRLAASALWPIPVALVALLLTAHIQKVAYCEEERGVPFIRRRAAGIP